MKPEKEKKQEFIFYYYYFVKKKRIRCGGSELIGCHCIKHEYTKVCIQVVLSKYECWISLNKQYRESSVNDTIRYNPALACPHVALSGSKNW